MSTNTVKITGAEEFDSVALRSGQPVAVDFWAEWCGPCKALGPALEEAASELADQARIAKVNIDDAENRDIATRYGISSIPTILYFKDGELVDRSVGLLGKEAIVERLNSLN